MQQFDRILRRKGTRTMRWIPTLPVLQEEEEPELREFMGGIEDDIRAMVGSHYYFIRCDAVGPALCRVPLFTGGKYPREVVDHFQHGITDDDLSHAIRWGEGNTPVTGYYRISDHIEGKLRALLDA